MTGIEGKRSSAAEALAAAGDREAAEDIGGLDAAAGAADARLAAVRSGLVERLIYGPLPDIDELRAGGRIAAELEGRTHPVLAAALAKLGEGVAFAADGKLSEELREAVAREGGYGLTIPTAHGGKGDSYLQLAAIEEALAANGLGALAVELSGQLTIGAGSLIGYGSDSQKRTFLPLVAEGTLMGFALTEVGTGVNAKKIAAYVETDADGTYRLFADGVRNKLWITNARHGGLVAIVARIGRTGRDLGLFITRLPDSDVALGDAGLGVPLRPLRGRRLHRQHQFAAPLRELSDFRGKPHPRRRRRSALLQPQARPLHAGRHVGRLSAHAGLGRQRLCPPAARRRRIGHPP